VSSSGDLPGRDDTGVGDDPYDLERFVSAQNSADTYGHAIGELRGGRKTTHWMWFVFPQLTGLGRSQMSRTYAISSLEEAAAFLRHPVLGPRLIDCTGALLDVQDRHASEILGAVDAQKLQSSMTLFMRAAPGVALFGEVLVRYFGGGPDPATDRRLGWGPDGDRGEVGGAAVPPPP
jgi:uncharacterized protein (DUF1810 family)